jgi:hypothetical protein
VKLADYLPTPAGISREALTVVLGALIAAVVISQLPPVKKFIKDAWAA